MMKYIVRLVGFLLALTALLAGMAFLLPQQQHVERSLQIEAPVSVIQPFLTTPKKFNQWSPWATIDPNGTRYSYSGPETGVGAKMSWVSDHKQVGSGTQEVRSVSDERVDIYLDFGDQGDANAYYLLEPNENGTMLTWAFDTDMGNNPIGRWMGMMMDKWVGNSYEEGLQNLNREAKKVLAEMQENDKANQYLEPVLELTELEATPIAFIRGSATTSPETIGPAQAEAFGKLMSGIQAQELVIAGAPLAVNELYDQDNDVYNFLAAIPLETIADIELGEGIELGTTYAGTAIKATHTGSYAGLPATYEKIEAYATDNGFIANGNSWEQYVSDAATVAPEEVITLIFWPVTTAESAGSE